MEEDWWGRWSLRVGEKEGHLFEENWTEQGLGLKLEGVLLVVKVEGVEVEVEVERLVGERVQVEQRGLYFLVLGVASLLGVETFEVVYQPHLSWRPHNPFVQFK